jgi:hypothetical protein
VDTIDFDGDGDMDVVSGWEFSKRVNVYLNPGGSAAVAEWPTVNVTLPLGTPGVEDAAFVDLGGDGRTDVVSAMQGGKQIGLHWAAPAPQNLLDPTQWTSARLPAASILKKQWMRVRGVQLDRANGPDILAGSLNGGIYWFESPSNPQDLNAWKSHLIGSARWIMSCEPVDMDGDGDVDVLFSDRSVVAWYENVGLPGNTGTSWARHVIGSVPSTRWLDYADVNNDGLSDVVATNPRGNSPAYWFRRMDSAGRQWHATAITIQGRRPASGQTQAVSIGDLDRDGSADLVFTTIGRGSCVYWVQFSQSAATGLATPHAVSLTGNGKYDNVKVVDIDLDGDLDIVTSEENKGVGVVWFENPSVA